MRHSILYSFLAAITLCFAAIHATADSLNLGERIQPIPRSAVFQDEGHFTWGGSMIRGEDGRYYLCYSRWPYKHEMAGWITHSEIALAVADHPLGPYKHHSVLLQGRGEGFFDANMIHNPHVHKFDGKYYLYYVGSTTHEERRETRMSQRVGVAMADCITGPWERLPEPLIDVTPNSFDGGFTTNPSVTKFGDQYIMIYKCLDDRTQIVFHGVAFSDSPTGPFKKHDEPIFTDDEHRFPAEDPFIFTYEGTLYAVLSDHAVFTDIHQALAMFTSPNGIDWELAENYLVSTLEVTWEDGEKEELADLERLQIYFDEDGEPAVMFCAATRGQRAPGTTFNIHIPLKESLLSRSSDTPPCCETE